MVQVALYFGSFVLQVGTIALSIVALVSTSWVKTETPASSPVQFKSEYGLFQRCDSSSWTGTRTTCRKFPSRSQDCATPLTLLMAEYPALAAPTSPLTAAPVASDGRLSTKTALRKDKHKHDGDEDDDDEMWTFCDSWITAGYAGLLSVTFGGAALLSNLLVMISGRVKREGGWRVVACLAALHGGWLLVAVSLVAYEFNHDGRFYLASRFGTAFILACVSAGLNLLVALEFVVVGALGLMRQDDYVRIRD